tara:strand:+ start:1257 stop:1835 length:579 start_codon:yes stop_codon:yes gene_type:complete
MVINLNWIGDNYENIIQWSKNITKNDELSEELAHYAIEKFMTHKRYEEINLKHEAEPNYGHCRGFILAIMRNSWIGKKSEFSRIHKAHRADIGSRKRVVTDEHFTRLTDLPDEPYDIETDYLHEAITGILEEMELDIEGKLWYNARLFKMYLETGNFSEIARRTDIPRMSISNAVDECRTYVQQQLKDRKII